jgi:carbon storage regulator
MLVLSRKHSQSVVIGDDIEVMVVDIRGDKVRLGFKAPEWTPVHRKEIHESMIRNGESVRSLVKSITPAPQDAPRSISAIIGEIDRLLTAIKGRVATDKVASFKVAELEVSFVHLVSLVEGGR